MTIERAFASGSSTLNQTSWTQINGMTLTPGAGDYLAVFSAEIQFAASPTGSILRIAIYVDGTIVDHSERQIQDNSSLNDMYIGVVTSAYVSPGAAEVVEVQYIIDGGSMAVTNRELNLFPAPGTNYQDGDIVNDTIAGTWTTLDTMTRTPASGTYLLLFTASAQPPSATETIGFRLSVGGSPVVHTERQMFLESSAAPASYCVMIAAMISPNGSQVVEIEWARVTGSGTQTCYERNMIMIGIPSADIKQALGTADDTDSTSGSDVPIDDMTITDPGDNDWLVFFSSSDYYGSLSSGEGMTTYKIYEGGAEDTNLTRIFEHEDSIDYARMTLFTTGRITLGLSTDDILAYWQANSTVQRTVYERSLVIIREPTVSYKLEGITKDDDGVALGSCECFLVKDNLDDTYTFIAHVTSNAVTGAYSFTGIPDNDANYQVISWKDDSPHVIDVTDHILTPEVE